LLEADQILELSIQGPLDPNHQVLIENE
jgi:hypothetical protein